MRLIILFACRSLGSTQAAHDPILEHYAGASGYQSEWWRLTASLTDGGGRPWDFEWSLYRRHAQPEA